MPKPDIHIWRDYTPDMAYDLAIRDAWAFLAREMIQGVEDGSVGHKPEWTLSEWAKNEFERKFLNAVSDKLIHAPTHTKKYDEDSAIECPVCGSTDMDESETDEDGYVCALGHRYRLTQIYEWEDPIIPR